MAGRRPKPSRVKEIEGNAGKRPVNKNEPRPRLAIPDCPDHLDELAKQEWNRIAPELFRLGLLTNIDRAGIAAYCQSWSRWVDAENNLKKFGTVIKTPKGYPIQNPYLSIANAAVDQMRKFEIEFGMTPSSRSRIDTSRLMPLSDSPAPAQCQEEDQDPLAEFLVQ